jgi:primosomal replication protein N
MKNTNNVVSLAGTVCSSFEFNHTAFREDFYLVSLSTIRRSGAEDILPVMVSKKIINPAIDMTGTRIEVEGSFRSWNFIENQRRRLTLYIFADVFRETEKEDDNYIFLSGHVCRQPIYRLTPSGRQITDILLAVNRRYGKSDYIPCLCWERNAVYIADTAQTGDKLDITGRIQSRTYQKKISEDIYEERTAYEVSSNWIGTEAAGNEEKLE